MLGYIEYDENTKTLRLEQRRVMGGMFLSLTFGRENRGVVGRWKATRAARKMREAGVRQAVFPVDFPYTAEFLRFGVVPVDTLPLRRAVCPHYVKARMKELQIPQMFDALGSKLVNGLKMAGKEHGFDLVTSGMPALFYLRIANDDSLYLHQEWIAECVSRGVFFASHHNHFINAALTEDDIKKTIEIAEDAFKAVKKNHPELG